MCRKNPAGAGLRVTAMPTVNRAAPRREPGQGAQGHDPYRPVTPSPLTRPLPIGRRSHIFLTFFRLAGRC